jgi:hypothetical protein
MERMELFAASPIELVSNQPPSSKPKYLQLVQLTSGRDTIENNSPHFPSRPFDFGIAPNKHSAVLTW